LKGGFIGVFREQLATAIKTRRIGAALELSLTLNHLEGALKLLGVGLVTSTVVFVVEVVYFAVGSFLDNRRAPVMFEFVN
jgi:hypothetical protein